MARKKSDKKYLAALLLGALAFGGGVLAMPTVNAQDQFVRMQESAKLFEKNPERFLQTQDLGLRGGFDLSDREFSDNFLAEEFVGSVNEGALKEAIEAGDYESWKDALQNMMVPEGDMGIISEEDFKVLASLRKLKTGEED